VPEFDVIEPLMFALVAVTFPPAVTLKLVLVIAPVFEIVRFGVTSEFAAIDPRINVESNTA
jgi:hypothetical protein